MFILVKDIVKIMSEMAPARLAERGTAGWPV